MFVVYKDLLPFLKLEAKLLNKSVIALSMAFLTNLMDIILHIDKYLNVIIHQYGAWTYCLLFLIIFCETGLVVTPFLPGDSLLFAVGALAATDSLSIIGLFFVLLIAAIAGDSVNYSIGKKFGEKILPKEDKFFYKKEYLVRTKQFYEKHGKKTIILARFVPIVRTFAPFVAGVGHMSYPTFLTYNVVGGISWIAMLLFGGYYFGQVPIVKNNFSAAIFLIIILSIMPGLIEFLRQKYTKID